jgi:hypothetical protein
MYYYTRILKNKYIVPSEPYKDSELRIGSAALAIVGTLASILSKEREFDQKERTVP